MNELCLGQSKVLFISLKATHSIFGMHAGLYVCLIMTIIVIEM